MCEVCQTKNLSKEIRGVKDIGRLLLIVPNPQRSGQGRSSLFAHNCNLEALVFLFCYPGGHFRFILIPWRCLQNGIRQIIRTPTPAPSPTTLIRTLLTAKTKLGNVCRFEISENHLVALQLDNKTLQHSNKFKYKE